MGTGPSVPSAGQGRRRTRTGGGRGRAGLFLPLARSGDQGRDPVRIGPRDPLEGSKADVSYSPS
eukprot:scaffold7522_cov417-Prasinococcus_capsulatus_cf.AAC.1